MLGLTASKLAIHYILSYTTLHPDEKLRNGPRTIKFAFDIAGFIA